MSGGTTNSSLSDWITAVATAATALFAAITGLAAWLAYRRQVRHDFPVVELDLRWSIEGDIGPHLSLRFVILNRLDETLIVHQCMIKEPKGATISSGVTSRDGGRAPSKGTASQIQLNYNIPRCGSYLSGPPGAGPIAADIVPFTLFVSLPGGWHFGKLVIHLLISSDASTIRDKRITIKKIVPVDAHMKIDAKASKSD